MANQYPESLLSVHFNFFVSKSEQADTSSLSEAEKKQLEQRAQFETSGRGYYAIQSTKVSLCGPLVTREANPEAEFSVSAVHYWDSYC